MYQTGGLRVKKNIPFKIARGNFANLSIRVIAAKFYYFLREIQERKHKYDLCLDFDWSKQNYNRTALLNLIISLHPKNNNVAYLEIGCAGDATFNSIFTMNKTGVDPDQGGNVRLTSDEFFDSQKHKFDLIFIDGLHTYEQVKKDFVNALSALNENGVIVLDDMIPRNWKEHQTPRVQTQWNGDVWKLLFDLPLLKGLEYRVVLIDSGQCVVFPKCEIEITDEFLQSNLRDFQFGYFYENFKKIPSLELDAGRAWIKENMAQ